MKAAQLCLTVSGNSVMPVVGHAQPPAPGAATRLSQWVAEAGQVGMGWSVRRSMLHRTLYTENGDRIGRIEDLEMAEERIAEMRQARADRWRAFEPHAMAALLQLRRSIAGAAG